MKTAKPQAATVAWLVIGALAGVVLAAAPARKTPVPESALGARGLDDCHPLSAR